MYQAYYNMEVLPFENTPDPRFFYASEQHREALAAIEYTIRMRKGFVLVTGEIGSGKTTVGHTMCERCANDAVIVQILHGHRTPGELVRQLCRRLRINVQPTDDHAQLLEKLQMVLVDQIREERPVVIFVDEAQTLSDEALEELRLLSNFDTNHERVVQVVLVGQPELRQRIQGPIHRALRQRISMAKQLWPLNLEEVGQYVKYRIAAASLDRDQSGVSFTDDALAGIYEASRGIPRLINVICDNCLLLGMVRETREIDAEIVSRVIDDMVPQFDEVSYDQEPFEFDATPLSLAG